MSRLETRDLDIKIMIDRCMLGWLSAVTKQPAKVVLCHLYDLTTKPVESLVTRNGTWSSKKIVFPGTDIKLKVSASRCYDGSAYRKAKAAWWNKCEADNLDIGPNDKTLPAQWKLDNPTPDRDSHEFNYICCKLTLLNGKTNILMSQSDMDTLVTETFLLGDPDE